MHAELDAVENEGLAQKSVLESRVGEDLDSIDRDRLAVPRQGERGLDVRAPLLEAARDVLLVTDASFLKREDASVVVGELTVEVSAADDRSEVDALHDAADLIGELRLGYRQHLHGDEKAAEIGRGESTTAAGADRGRGGAVDLGVGDAVKE